MAWIIRAPDRRAQFEARSHERETIPDGNVSCGRNWPARWRRSRLKAGCTVESPGQPVENTLVWREADYQSAAGWQPAPQYFGGLSSHLVGRMSMRTARIGCPTKLRTRWAHGVK